MNRERVIVVGAGPVGLSTALAVAEAGIDVLVLDQASTLEDHTRAATLLPGTLQVLAGLDVARPLIARGRRVERLQWRTRSGTISAQMHLSALKLLTAYPFRLHLDQSVLQMILLSRLARTSRVELRFGAQVEAITDAGCGGRVRAGTDWYAGRYVIAADGAHSRLRTLVGARLEQAGPAARILQILTQTPLDEMLPQLAPLTFVQDAVSACTVLALPEHWRIIMRVPDSAAETRLSRASVRALARRALPLGRSKRLKIHSAQDYALQRGVLRSYRHGHVVFVGEAAHVLPAAEGLSLNTGIQDGVELGRAIAAVLSGPTSPAVLEQWSQRRRHLLLHRLQPGSSEQTSQDLGGESARRATGLARLRAVADDPVATRAWLAETSMLDAPIRPRQSQSACRCSSPELTRQSAGGSPNQGAPGSSPSAPPLRPGAAGRPRTPQVA